MSLPQATLESLKSSRDFDVFPDKPAVYEIYNNVTGDRFLGATDRLRTRIRKHSAQFRSGTHQTHSLAAAYSEHGPANLLVRVIHFPIRKPLALCYREWFEKLQPTYNGQESFRRFMSSKAHQPDREHFWTALPPNVATWVYRVAKRTGTTEWFVISDVICREYRRRRAKVVGTKNGLTV